MIRWMVAAAVLATVPASTSTGIGATAGTAAERGAATQVADPPAATLPHRVELISDSSIAAIRWAGKTDWLTTVDWEISLESCRRLVYPSCRGREGYAPTTAKEKLDGDAATLGPADPTDVLVIGVGYDDWETRFRDDFRTVIGAARDAGFRTIVWLTYRDHNSYQLPAGSAELFSNYTEMNTILHEELETGAYPEVRVWDYRTFTAPHPDWFTSDGIHLTATGAEYVASWFSAHFTSESPPWTHS